MWGKGWLNAVSLTLEKYGGHCKKLTSHFVSKISIANHIFRDLVIKTKDGLRIINSPAM